MIRRDYDELLRSVTFQVENLRTLDLATPDALAKLWTHGWNLGQAILSLQIEIHSTAEHGQAKNTLTKVQEMHATIPRPILNACSQWGLI